MSPAGFHSAESRHDEQASCVSLVGVQSDPGDSGRTGPRPGWHVHSQLGDGKNPSQSNESMCIGRQPLLNGPHDPGDQMAFYAIFTTVILD